MMAVAVAMAMAVAVAVAVARKDRCSAQSLNLSNN